MYSYVHNKVHNSLKHSRAKDLVHIYNNSNLLQYWRSPRPAQWYRLNEVHSDDDLDGEDDNKAEMDLNNRGTNVDNNDIDNIDLDLDDLDLDDDDDNGGDGNLWVFDFDEADVYVIMRQCMKIMRGPLEDHLLETSLLDKVFCVTIMLLWGQ